MTAGGTAERRARLSRRSLLRAGLATGAIGAGAVLSSRGLNRGAGAAATAMYRVLVPGLAADQSAPPVSGLSWVPGSTVKVEQLIGDYDKQFKQPTQDQTQSRYGIIGTDLGNSFEHNGRAYFLFGDTIAPGAPDPMGYSESTDPAAPLRIDFVSNAPGTFVAVKPPGVSMGPFEVPVAGLSLGGVMYVVVKTNYSPDSLTDTSLLTRFDEGAHTFSSIRQVSQLPGGHFIKMTLRLAPGPVPGAAGSSQHVLMFGSGEYRKSNAYLAVVPAESFASGDNTRYFAGMEGALPQWTASEDAAVPIVTHPTIGDISVLFVQQLGLWLMTYDSRDPQGVILRYAAQPWGPWSDPVIIFNAQRDHAQGAFIHDPRLQPDDGLAGPVTVGNPAQVAGGAYAPYIVERFTQVSGGNLTLHYVLSTWNPYTVVRMRSTLSIVH